MERISFFSVRLILTTLIVIIFFQSRVIAANNTMDNNSMNIVRMIMPKQDSLVIGKKPVIKCMISEPFTPENLLVLFDGVDITGILKINANGFEFHPIKIIPPGPHTLSVTLYTSDGREIQKDFSFSTRHSKAFEEVYSDNELTGLYETILTKSKNVDTIPYSKIESNFGSHNRLKNKGWEFSLSTNLRFFDQNLPVLSPQRKGVDLVDYLLQGKYSSNRLEFLTEIGDIQVDETQNTVQALARRGGRFSLQYSDLSLDGFVVNSEQSFGLKKGMGIKGSLDDHIMGVSGEAGLFSDKVRLKTIYVTGGEPGNSFGIWTTSGGKKGDVLGFLVKADPFGQRLNAEAELDLSEFDPDTSDEFSHDSDKACRLQVNGSLGNYSYEATYEYMGPDYEVIGNQGLQKNREGFMFRAGADFKIHSINLSLSRYNDNVKGDDLYPRIYTYQGIIDYTFKKYQNLPIGLSYQRSIIDSTMEPESTPHVRMDTDIITGRINYMDGSWNIGFQTSHSMQNDKTNGGADSTTTTCTFTPTYSTEHFSISPNFSFNRSKYHLTGVRTDTYTVNLDLRGDVFQKRITYELAGTYNRIESSDSSIDQDKINTDFRFAYFLSKSLWGFSDPSLGIRGQYNITNNRGYGQRNDELVILLFFSTDISFSF